MNRKDHLARYVFIGVLSVAFVIVFLVRLININVTGSGYYAETAHNNYRTRTETIQALRGEIYDRNGKPLVTNEYHYNIYIEYGAFSTMTNTDKNETVLRLADCIGEKGEGEKTVEIQSPFMKVSNSSKTSYIIEYNSSFMSTVYGSRLEKMLLELTEKDELPPAKDAYDLLLYRYGLTDKDGKSTYVKPDEELLLSVRLDMELHNFSYTEPYVYVKDVGMELVTLVEETALRGIKVSTEVKRIYNYEGYASHILGRTGKIQQAKADYYKDLGYSMNSVVGVSGAEEAFETYLHGTDGEKTVIEDEYGNIIDEYVSKEPAAGKNVFLTIDIDLQITAEDALADNIKRIVKNAEEKEGEYDGEDANSGALTFVKADTGEVLALASNPTYNLATFSEDYEKLSKDENSPLFNRALEGTYAPGSTFKPGVAVAALEEGIITPYTTLPCNGVYDYYESSGFLPACWIYNMFGGRHGNLEVVEAIQDSCNCFFYEVGRQLTISNMNRYCKAYGLGRATGIELNEKTGVLAGPEYRDENGLESWTDGQTVTAAIGQSDNLFSPLQISVYISTVIGNGTRYNAHILSEVKDFYTDEVVYTYEPTVADGCIDISKETVNMVKSGMKNVMENGSAATVFSNYPITIGGKTGTAQVRADESDNAVFTAFAPYAEPEVVATCVIEHGASGSSAGWCIKALFDDYFDIEPTVEADSVETGGETEVD